jgi:hypothetical protein
LGPAIKAYLFEHPMTTEQIAVKRAYLRQWIMAPVWMGAGVEELRADIDKLTTPDAFENWLRRADYLGVDPL